VKLGFFIAIATNQLLQTPAPLAIRQPLRRAFHPWHLVESGCLPTTVLNDFAV
jgi:hypothetical protein